ncbi:nicotinamide mononucleotide adenylyltransferase, partial [Phenoliferia sp. Uapishka_3]
MDTTYTFPLQRLSGLHESATATQQLKPLVLVACGSYSPCTFLHLRMFEMARDHARANGWVVVGGYLSPVNDGYHKKGLAASNHRVAMCELAVQDSDWLMVDSWEARAPAYSPTAKVLDHFHDEINVKRGGVECEVTDEWTGEVRRERRQARIMLLAGSDLILTMSEPGVWSEKDVCSLSYFGSYYSFY